LDVLVLPRTQRVDILHALLPQPTPLHLRRLEVVDQQRDALVYLAGLEVRELLGHGTRGFNLERDGY
jgi:hypothetical protein